MKTHPMSPLGYLFNLTGGFRINVNNLIETNAILSKKSAFTCKTKNLMKKCALHRHKFEKVLFSFF